MQSTFTEQIKAIQMAISIIRESHAGQFLMTQQFLNDAGATIAALNLTKDIHNSVLLEALEELIDSVEGGKCEYSQLEKARKVVFQVRQNSVRERNT